MASISPPKGALTANVSREITVPLKFTCASAAPPVSTASTSAIAQILSILLFMVEVSLPLVGHARAAPGRVHCASVRYWPKGWFSMSPGPR